VSEFGDKGSQVGQLTKQLGKENSAHLSVFYFQFNESVKTKNA
jgi:hypothetical protein